LFAALLVCFSCFLFLVVVSCPLHLAFLVSCCCLLSSPPRLNALDPSPSGVLSLFLFLFPVLPPLLVRVVR
jgi:hypothetical protein